MHSQQRLETALKSVSIRKGITKVPGGPVAELAASRPAKHRVHRPLSSKHPLNGKFLLLALTVLSPQRAVRLQSLADHQGQTCTHLKFDGIAMNGSPDTGIQLSHFCTPVSGLHFTLIGEAELIEDSNNPGKSPHPSTLTLYSCVPAGLQVSEGLLAMNCQATYLRRFATNLRYSRPSANYP